MRVRRERIEVRRPEVEEQQPPPKPPEEEKAQEIERERLARRNTRFEDTPPNQLVQGITAPPASENTVSVSTATASPEVRTLRRAAVGEMKSASASLREVAAYAGEAAAQLANHQEVGRVATGLDGASDVFRRISETAFEAGRALPQKWQGLKRIRPELYAAQGRVAEARGLADVATDVLEQVRTTAKHPGVATAVERLGAVRDGLDEVDGRLGRALGQATVSEGLQPPPARGEDAAATEGPASNLTEEDVRKLGSALPPDGGTQMMWVRNDGYPEPAALAGTMMQRAQEQGLLGKEQTDASADAANRALPKDEVKQFTAADVAGMAKDAGIALENVDPNQLQQAARLINSATAPQEQRDRIALSLNNLSVAANGKAPELSRQDMVNMLWAQAKIPGHALTKLSDAELKSKLSDITRAANTPGEHKLKVGSHDVKLSVSDDGSLAKTETKKPSFLSKLGKIAKIGLAAASFIPGPIGLAARAVNGVIGVVDGIRKGNIVGAITSGLGAVAAGAGAIAGKATSGIAYATSRVAGGLSKVVSGAQSLVNGIKNRSLTAGLTGIANIAGGVSDGLGGLGQRFADASKHFGNVSRFISGANSAQKAIAAARRGDIGGAITSGLSGAANMVGATGNEGLSEQLSRYAGWSSTATNVYQSVKSGDYLGAASQVSGFIGSEVVKDPEAQQRLKDFSTVLNGAKGLQQAVKSKDWLAAAVAGTEIAGALARNGSNTRADLEGAKSTLEASQQLRDAIRTGNPEAIGAALFGLQDTVRREVGGFTERHAKPPEVAGPPSELISTGPEKNPDGTDKLPILEGRDFSQLLSAAPGATPGNGVGRDVFIDGPGTAGPNGAQGVSAPGKPPLQYSSAVYMAQTQLNEWSRYFNKGFELKEDGLLGQNTERALKTFQSDYELSPTGKLDAATRRKLEEMSTSIAFAPLQGIEAERRRATLLGDARTTLASAKAFAGDNKDLTSMGASFHYGVTVDLPRLIGNLERAADPSKPGFSESGLRTAIDDVKRMQSYLTQVREREGKVIDVAYNVAVGAKFIADSTIKVLGKACPPLQLAYGALSNGLPKLINDGDWKQALIQGGIGALGAKVGGKTVDPYSLSEVLGKEVRASLLKASGGIIDDIGKLKASSQADFEAKVKAIFERRLSAAAGEVIAKASMSPLGNIKFDDKAASLIKYMMQKKVEDQVKGLFTEMIRSFPG
ncbi:MAG: peptidoglycan-binding protein [Myxococcales bacterium]|nr:peptidoglycan-binding protein [Myxococcales bacterium]